jgi:hypothetical protein
LDWLTDALEDRLPRRDLRLYNEKKDPSAFRKLFINRDGGPAKFIGTATPLILNHRLSAQQGLFLCPGDVRASWADNLAASSKRGQPRARSFVLEAEALEEAFEALAVMNVSARSLFPGIDGYAKSVAHRGKLLWKLPVPND